MADQTQSEKPLRDDPSAAQSSDVQEKDDDRPASKSFESQKEEPVRDDSSTNEYLLADGRQCTDDNPRTNYVVEMRRQSNPHHLTRQVHGLLSNMKSMAYPQDTYIDFTMNRFMHELAEKTINAAEPLEDQEEPTLPPNDPNPSVDPLPSDTMSESSASEGDFLNDTNIPLALTKGQASQEMTLDMHYLMNLIKTGAIPVMMCLTTLSGISSDKEALLREFTEEAVKFDNSKSELASRYFKSLEEKVSKDGLSSFSFNVLGSYPFDDLMWLLATKRTSITLCFLSCLAQALKLRNVPIDNLHLAESNVHFSIGSDEKIPVQKHKEWLFLEVTKRLQGLIKQPKIKLRLLEAGVSLVNVFNIGPSKAAYEFLPFLAQFCKRSLPLVFVSHEDSQQLNQPLTDDSFKECRTSLNHLLNAYKPRVKHLRHYAEGGRKSDSSCDDPENPKTPLWFLASDCPLSGELSCLQSLKKTLGITATPHVLNMSVINETREKLERIVVKNMTKYADTIPLRWIFLHSFLLTLKVSLTTRADVTALAVSCDIGMDDSEVEVFLKTFTSFGSLLYIPSLTNVIIVDIEHFTDCLDKVYSYQDPSKACCYGFVSAAAIDELVHAEKIDASLFVSVLKAFHFAVPIVKSRVALKHYKIDMNDQSFYIPSVRPLKSTNGPQVDSLYLCINPEYTPGNMQVLLVRHILKYSNCFLHPHVSINATVIDVHCAGEECVPVTVIDHGDFTELRLDRSHSPQSYKEACLLLARACYTALEDLGLSLGNIKYKFALLCSAGLTMKYHDLPLDKTVKCAICEKTSTPGSLKMREHWSTAVSELYSENNALEKEKKDFYTFEEMTELAVKLSKEFIDEKRQQELFEILKIPRNEVADASTSGPELFLRLLLCWKKKETVAVNGKRQREILEETLEILGFSC